MHFTRFIIASQFFRLFVQVRVDIPVLFGVYCICNQKLQKVINNRTKGGEKMVNLKEKREAKNMSQQDLADAVGISRQAISNIEIGTAKPDVKHAIIIGRVLEFNWVLFYDEENSG